MLEAWLGDRSGKRYPRPVWGRFERDILNAEGRQVPASLCEASLAWSCRLAVGALVRVRLEQPSTVTRSGCVDRHALPVLRLLGLHLPTLGVGCSIRHVGLSNDARQLGEQGVHGRAVAAV